MNVSVNVDGECAGTHAEKSGRGKGGVKYGNYTASGLINETHLLPVFLHSA